jgi:deoxyribodipyrimidine photo-lyase
VSAVIFWFRRDLRLGDNSALNAALESGQAVIPLFIFDPALLNGERASAARTAFLLAGLRKLDDALRAQGSALLVRQGEPLQVLHDLFPETDATALYFNRDYSPYARQRDRAIHEAFGAERVRTEHDLLLHPPTTVMTGAGKPYTVYTPFKRAWLEKPKEQPRTASGRWHDLSGIRQEPMPSEHDLGAAHSIELPEAGEEAALRRLERYTSVAMHRYADRRNEAFAHPWLEQAQGTSTLSPYLRLGMLSARQAYAAAWAAHEGTHHAGARNSIALWISELAWRDFYVHILYHFPHVMNSSFRAEYDAVAWRNAPDELAQWAAGMTGYPIVDAAMRQLTQTGWMHNRARMIVANFLTKDLLLYWRAGDVHFMQHLLDGDPAANNGGWQWAAGTGTDAQPYFRIFNPVSQSQKCDPTGAYIRYFVPELRDVPLEHLHAPWEMLIPPSSYPRPMVDHPWARERTLAAFRAVRPTLEAE